ncbi:phosphotransferase enzyme family protein [Ornithinimicrobium cavernae]|uniref:phosphotransferase enzyme family protein n=1 Tax=Ornithinimicrobium cavernae TaxID=2666047 RepID=UPI000D6978A6|nr:phosphotransferase [Ornithinimicrobium cavernae]
MSELVPLTAWSGLEVMGPLSGGHRNTVLLGRLGEHRVVIRRSRRSAESLAWELDLLEHLHTDGVVVPETVPTADGQRHRDGWHVQLHIDGREPAPADDQALLAALRDVHARTSGWPQRPGSRSARELLTTEVGGDIDLSAVPPSLRETLRAAWAVVDPQARCVVHGDAGGANALVLSDGRCALLDWDEARVDDPLFDLAAPNEPLHTRAALAWEIATCWVVEPDYARSLVSRLE